MAIKKTIKTDNVKKLKRILKELKTTELRIGIFGESGGKILIIANVNEYGVNIKVTEKMRAYLNSQGLHLKKSTNYIKIPERSFIRNGYDQNKRKIQNEIDSNLDKVLNLEISLDSFYAKTGERLVSITKRYLTDLKKPPKHPFTVKKEGGKTNPLIASGQLRSSITWEKVRR